VPDGARRAPQAEELAFSRNLNDLSDADLMAIINAAALVAAPAQLMPPTPFAALVPDRYLAVYFANGARGRGNGIPDWTGASAPPGYLRVGSGRGTPRAR
jgi:hypothetical protein